MKKINSALNILVWEIFFIIFFNEIRKKKKTNSFYISYKNNIKIFLKLSINKYSKCTC